MKAIIYYRKSTDRDDKQANSLEHQLSNCRRIAQTNNFDIVEEIGESKSAKDEGTRAGFNRMLKLCKTGKIDYIVIDEPKRLSRNNLDSARVIDLFDKKQIKGIYSTGRLYQADQINDVFLLQLDLSLSKMDNDHRSKDVKDKMITCMNNTGRFLGKASFGYKNVTIKKGHKIIVLDEKEAKLVKEIFALRLENKAYSIIAEIIKNKYGNKIDIRYTANKMRDIATNKFYYGIFKWAGKEIIGSHKPIITKEIYDAANGIGKGVHGTKERIYENVLSQRPHYFKGLVRDTAGIMLSSYEKKGFIYYSSQSRSQVKVCINENILFEKIGAIIKEIDFQDDSMAKNINKFVLELLQSKTNEINSEVSDLEKKIKLSKEKQAKLLDMKLDELIDEKTYLFKYNLLENEIKDFLEQQSQYKNNNFSAKTQLLFELTKSLYLSYLRANREGKIYIIKKLLFELLVDTKKELQITESPIFQSSKILKNAFGGAQQINFRTYKALLSRIDLQDLREFQKWLLTL